MAKIKKLITRSLQETELEIKSKNRMEDSRMEGNSFQNNLKGVNKGLNG